MSKKQKILIILGLIFVLFLLFNFTQADTGLGSPVVTGSSQPAPTNSQSNMEDAMSLTYIVANIFGLLVKLAAFFVNFSINLNFRVQETPIITTGWQITRDLANLGFVLFIIIIAIATILRMQQYGAKNTLGKLIAVALLVNFSLVFAGVFIDFSNMLTKFFIDNTTTISRGGMAEALVSVFNPGKFLDTAEQGKEAGWLEKIKGFWEALTNPGKALKALATWFAGISFVIAFTLILALTLFTLAIMFLIRFLWLSILLILVPMACLFWILPVTKNLWDKWWNHFIKWILFAPTASFFLFLTVKMLTDYKDKINQISLLAQGTGTAAVKAFEGQIPNTDLPGQVATGAIFVGLLLGGLFAANSMGNYGSRAVLGMAGQVGRWARGAIGGMAAGGAQRTFMSGVRRDAATGEVTTRGQRIAAAISRVPGFRGVAQRISTFSAPQARAEEVERYRKDNLVNLSNEALINQMTAPGAFVNRTAAAAMIQDAARRNLTGNAQIVPLLNRYLNTAQGMGNINTVLNNRPDLAPAVTPGVPAAQAIQQVMQRIRADKADEISHDALGQQNVVLNLDNSKLRRIGTVGEQRQKDAIENAINNAIANINLLNPQQQIALNRIEAHVRTLRDGGNW